MPASNRQEFPDIEGYTIARRLGRGGMADVYLGTQLSLARPVAIKVLAAERTHGEDVVARFEHEARTIARLAHPHIVSIYDVGRTSDGRLYYIMPHLPNGDLSTRDLKADTDAIAAVIRAMCQALGYAHGLGIVHRDVKPANILFDKVDRPLLADFGIALTTLVSARMTLEGSTIGSTGYMSPEQARGLATDGRSDLYSLGVVCYELLSGELPFQGPNTLAMALAHVEQPIPRLPEPRRQWQAFIDQAMAKSPLERFQSAAEMQAALDLIAPQAGPAVTASASPKARSPQSGAPRSRWRVALDLAAAMTLIVLGVAVLLLALVTPHSETQPREALTVDMSSGSAAGTGNTEAVAAESIHDNVALTASTDVQLAAEPDPVPAIEPLALPPSHTPAPAKAVKQIHASISAPHASEPSAGATMRDHNGPEFVLVPARTHLVGREYDVDHAFALGRFEVTRGEYSAFAIATGRAASKCRVPLQPFSRLRKLSWREPGFVQDDSHPVVCVSWDDANAYAQWLSERMHAHYRLPTHDEWVHAARLRPAGVEMCAQGHLGGDHTSLLRHDNTGACNDGFARTAPVGQFKPNVLGIHDLVGNVSEWTNECRAQANADAAAEKPCANAKFSGTSWRDDVDGDTYSEGEAATDVGYTTVGIRLLREVGTSELTAHR